MFSCNSRTLCPDSFVIGAYLVYDRGLNCQPTCKMGSAEKAEETVRNINNAQTTIERAAEILKALEIRDAHEQVENIGREQNDDVIQDLLLKYYAG